MNDFKNVYESAMQEVREFHIDISDCMDERKHKRRVRRRVQRLITTAFSAMCVIFICGFGTVKAAEYIQNEIRVKDWGFESADAITMARNDAENQTFVIDEEIEEVEEEIEETLQESFDEEARALTSTGEVAKVMMDEGVKEESMTEIPTKNYESLEEFKESEDIIFAYPSISIGDHIENTDIIVCGDWAMIYYEVDGKGLWLERTDYANTQGHASSKAFPSGVCNERTYTTPQGYTYTLIDSIRDSEEEQLQIHAAVTVGSYEAFIDFLGFTEKQAWNIMDNIDLSVYE